MPIRRSRSLGTTVNKYLFLYILLTIFSLIFSSINFLSVAEDTKLELVIYVSVPGDVVEGDNITITVTIKNNGTENIPPDPGKLIEDKLYIDDGNTPVSVNSTSNGLSSGAFIYLNLSWTAELGDHTLTVKLYYDDPNERDRWDEPITVSEREVDLKLNGIYIEENLRLGEPVAIFANATNIGKNTTKTVKASLYIDGNHEQSKTVEGLSKSETYNFSFNWVPKHFDNHTLNVTLDPENKIDEEDETNNYIEVDVFVDPYRFEWKSTSWHYRKFYAVNGTGNISISINFTMLLNQLGVYEKTFENDSIMVVKYFSTGDVDELVSTFKFQECTNFNNKTNASGILIWNVTEELSYYCVYFDVLENNGTREKIDETGDLIEFGNTIISFERPVEGWWLEFISPGDNYYPLSIVSPIEVYTVAEASNVSANLSLDGRYESTIVLESNDNVNWMKNYNFTKKGTWTITITAWDNASFQVIQIENLSVLAVPDLGVVRIVLPSQNVREGEHAEIRAVLNNTGYADAENYEVGLYLVQGSMTWTNSQVKNTTKVSIDKDESKEINLTWHPALYGNLDKEGKWIVGIWIYTNSTHKDSNLENNKGTNYSLRVVPGEKNSPLITIIELTDQQEIRKPVRIIAKITDESGIKSVNITIVDPEKTRYSRNMTQQENDRYLFEFENTSIIGEYNFSINAVDNSFYQKLSTTYGVFKIVEDATSPLIDYFGAYPSVQLKGGYVTISCISTDFMGVKSVRVMLKYPDGRLATKSMTNSASTGKYVYRQTYDILGKYIFNITSEDTSGNMRYTENKEFWITTDIDDVDGDGMPDWWEERYGFDPHDPTDAEQDEDGDGYTNVEEYNNGNNPLKRVSSLQEIAYKLRENWSYLIISVILFILIIALSIYELKRLKT
ncbi:MAG: hypothetical protein KAQ84_01540 [Thermoplasmatales archaeon]|nr:hypothetical protein [Thermoplasmatales archaeon]